MNQRKRPAPTDRPSPNQTNTAEHNALRRQEWTLHALAAQLGFRLAVRCTHCRRWLVAEESVRLHVGPVCAAKLDEQVVA